jgi:hypothetical protein
MEVYEMERLFFCIIFAQDQKHLIALNRQGVDVFQPTARITDQKEYVIEGLLTLEDVVKLVDNGYRVLVEEDASKRARATEFITTAEEWIKEFEESQKR